jgi:SAM-dependent methyltransferase
MSMDAADAPVTASAEEINRLRVYTGASRELMGWIEGARALTVLTVAIDIGLIELLRTRTSVKHVAEVTGVDADEVERLCRALEAHGVVAGDRGAYQLTHSYRLLSAPDAAIPLGDVIRHSRVIQRTLGRPSSDGQYTDLSPAEVLSMAAASGISALSSSAHVATDVVAEAVPQLDAVWRAGGHHLEVGCGVGNALFGIVSRYPALTAVGIEIDEATAAEATRRARSLGIDDRVEVRRMDACDLADEQQFDTAQWSQFFFPTATRAVVLEAMLRALKPAGYLAMPWLGVDPSDVSARRREMLRTGARGLRTRAPTSMVFLSDAVAGGRTRGRRERRFASLLTILFERWGVPARNVAELSAEVRGAGFEIVRSVPMPVSQFVLTRGLLLARRPA